MNELSSGTFNFNYAEGSSESVSSEGAFLVEEIVKAGVFKTGVFLVDFGKDDGVGRNVLGEFSLVLLPVIVDFGGQLLSKAGGRHEGKDVGVVLENEDLLVS